METDAVFSGSGQRRGKTIETIMEKQCTKRGTILAEIKKGSKRRQESKTRGILALRSREELGDRTAEIARHLGVSTPSITQAIEL